MKNSRQNNRQKSMEKGVKKAPKKGTKMVRMYSFEKEYPSSLTCGNLSELFLVGRTVLSESTRRNV